MNLEYQRILFWSEMMSVVCVLMWICNPWNTCSTGIIYYVWVSLLYHYAFASKLGHHLFSNGLLPVRCKARTEMNANLLSIQPLSKNIIHITTKTITNVFPKQSIYTYHLQYSGHFVQAQVPRCCLLWRSYDWLLIPIELQMLHRNQTPLYTFTADFRHYLWNK